MLSKHESSLDAIMQRASKCTATNALASHGLVIEDAACTLPSTQPVTLRQQSRVILCKLAHSDVGCALNPSSPPNLLVAYNKVA
jgi:hypothetical protein